MVGLQQGFATGEIGFGVSLHSSNPEPPMSRFGSKADIAFQRHVRFTPESGHWLSAQVRGAIKSAGTIQIGNLSRLKALEPENRLRTKTTQRVLRCGRLWDTTQITVPSSVHIVDTKRGKFEPEKFEDHYENALKDLLRKKQKGEKIER